MKAGGPNYVAQFMHFDEVSPTIESAIASYEYWWREEFSREHDHFQLVGQDNIRRYLPFSEVRVCVTEKDSTFEILARSAAALVTGARVTISKAHGVVLPSFEALGLEEPTTVIEETDDQLAAHIAALPAHHTERIRFADRDRVPERVRLAAAKNGIYLADEPVLAEGRIELLWYLREQSISHDYHRYGNQGARSAESRQEPA